MIPFQLSEKYSGVFFPSSVDDDVVALDVLKKEHSGKGSIEKHVVYVAEDKADAFERYSSCFERFWEALNREEFEKLVLSRESVVQGDFDRNYLLDIFIKACDMYPRMFIYLSFLPDGKAWLGCTPEILVAGKKSHYRTMALAGTMALPENTEMKNVEWSQKNRKEQDIVSEYVRDKVKPICKVIEEEGPYTSRAGHLVHLKTEFHFSPSDGVGVMDVVETLHPTPAVCGIPADKAKEFILANEDYERDYYSGIVGYFSSVGETNLYVNLRCACFSEKEAHFYAGGGILKDSIVTAEWEESETKMATILSLMS